MHLSETHAFVFFDLRPAEEEVTMALKRHYVGWGLAGFSCMRQ